MRSHAILPLLSSAALAAPALWGPPGSGGPWGSWGHGKSSTSGISSYAYYLYNDPAGSQIVSVPISANGSLINNPLKTPTGGNGSVYINSTTNAPVGADSLGSQGSVTIKDSFLFTVNAGSDTVSMFWIDPEAPAQPQLIGSPASTLGNFPISVDYSPKLGKACVLNGGVKAGVACFFVDPFSGLLADGPLRHLSKSIINETTPPNGPPGTAAQVSFNPDQSAVFATIKGNPGATPAKEGVLAVWPVENGCITHTDPIVSKFDGILVDFGFTFKSQKEIFLTDAASGAALVTVADDYSITEKEHTVIPGQQATCWSAWSPNLNTLYAIDAGVNHIPTLNGTTGAQTGNISVSIVPNGAVGVFDSALKDEVWLYSLLGSAGIGVFDLVNQKQTQYLDLSSVGSRQYFQGMALWPAC